MRQERRRIKDLVLPDFDLSLALCGQTDPELFFPDQSNGMWSAPAKAICRRCEVQKECLTWALKNDEQYGIWGGLTTLERQNLKGKRLRSKGARSLPLTVKQVENK